MTGPGRVNAAPMLRPTVWIATVCALALLPAAAQAGTISTDQTGKIHFTAGEGETNKLTLWVMDTGPIAAKDDTAPLNGCPPNTAPGWEAYKLCLGTSPDVSLGDGNDVARLYDGGTDSGLWIGRFVPVELTARLELAGIAHTGGVALPPISMLPSCEIFESTKTGKVFGPLPPRRKVL